MKTQRNYKDTVYRMLFKEPAHAGRSREEAVEKLMENCTLTREAAQEKAELYWDKSSEGGKQ